MGWQRRRHMPCVAAMHQLQPSTVLLGQLCMKCSPAAVSHAYMSVARLLADLGNPYDNGVLANCWEVFCAPIPPRWGQLGMQQRAEASAAAAAQQQQQQQQTVAAAGGDVQLVQVRALAVGGAWRASCMGVAGIQELSAAPLQHRVLQTPHTT